MKQKVISREYKVMLKSEHFGGSRFALLETAKEFWNEFTATIGDVALDTDGMLDKVEKDRTIRFYDRAKDRLRESSYVFRERVDRASEEREVTLKFRHPDRYISQDRDMDAVDGKDDDTKFEEDIKLPFLKLYSFATKHSIPADYRLDRMNDIGELYPGLKDELSNFRANESIDVVGKDGGFTARELVIVGGDNRADFQLRKKPKIEAECALIVWYDVRGDGEQPVVVEFSFRYGDKHEKYDGEAAQSALDVFKLLPNTMGNWVDAEGLTKTAYVYSRI